MRFGSCASGREATRVVLLATMLASLSAPLRSQQVVISQAYGSGGAPGAPWRNDFVELHNRTSTTVSLATWSIQYAPPFGTSWTKVDLAGSIAPGGYFLIALSSSGSNGAPLPAPDLASTAINLNVVDGKIALVDGQAPLPHQNSFVPGDSGVLDLIGYGAAIGYEGNGPAPSMNIASGIARNGAGCDDSNHNNLDFVAAAPVPRNGASAANVCTTVGACCGGGVCSVVQPGACNGTYQGDWTACPEPVYAPPTLGATPMVDISATGNALNFANNDDASANASLPWQFPLYGRNRTLISIGINGYLSFRPGTSATIAVNQAVPAPQTPNDLIAPFWDDLVLRSATSNVYVQAFLSPDRYVVQWKDASTFASGEITPDHVDFQAILYRTGQIEFRYGNFLATPTTAWTGTVGLENHAGTAAISVSQDVVTGGNVSLSWSAATSPLCLSPANDACASASPLTLDLASFGSTTYASHDGSSACDPFGKDVWYSVTTDAAGTLRVDTCGSSIDTALALYAACGASELACNDDCPSCGGGASCIDLANVPAGTYLVRVSDKGGPGGAFQVEARFELGNDDCTGAIPLAIPSLNQVSWSHATTELASVPGCFGPQPGQPQDFALTHGAWYRVNSAVAQTVTIDTLAGSSDTKLWVYDGSGGCGALACVTANDDIENAPFRSKVAFVATAGVDYYLLVAPFHPNDTTLATTIRVSADPTPSNDDCANATQLGAVSGAIPGTTKGATGIPQITDGANPSCQAAASGTAVFDVWYSFTAPCSGAYFFSTCGAFDTLMSLHSSCADANASHQLAPLAKTCDDDGPAGCAPGSSIEIELAASQSIWIRVASATSGKPSGDFTLRWSGPDADGDGTPNCVDGCPLDPAKSGPGVCGCGVPDVDTDGDAAPDCVDGCPLDPLKTAPGACGCGNPDADSDGDGTADCIDGCPQDPEKTKPGTCGCGVPDSDTDGDGALDCVDGCASDPLKTAPGLCGCGIADSDGDGDGTPDCLDGCPSDPAKIAPGQCGCGAADLDSDGDGTADCHDGCPSDPLKIAPGQCGCGVDELDSDADGLPDCVDNCDSLANPSQEDCDGDGIGDACEIGSGASSDVDQNGVPDECQPGAVLPYCTPGTSLAGCTPTLGASGTPSASAANGFVLTITGADGQRFGQLFYGIRWTQRTPFAAGYMCVAPPRQRMGGALFTGGTAGSCDGSLAVDLQLFAANFPGALGVPLTAGTTYYFEGSVRDTGSPGNRVMSDALAVTLLP